jgi:hypothetical protein
MYNSLLALVLKVLKERGEKEVVKKKRSISASLDSKSTIAMLWPFPKAFKVALKVCSSILHV